MRPKKVILAVSADVDRLSVLTFLLTTHGYRVLPSAGAEQALLLFRMEPPDLVLADLDMPVTNGAQMGEKMKGTCGHVPIMLLGNGEKLNGLPYCADAVLLPDAPTSVLLDRVSTLSARKRGPKKRVSEVLRELAIA